MAIPKINGTSACYYKQRTSSNEIIYHSKGLQSELENPESVNDDVVEPLSDTEVQKFEEHKDSDPSMDS